MSSRTSGSAASQASWPKTLSVPRSRPDVGIALAARPASAAPHTIDSAARGSMRRESTPGSSVISRPIA